LKIVEAGDEEEEEPAEAKQNKTASPQLETRSATVEKGQLCP